MFNVSTEEISQTKVEPAPATGLRTKSQTKQRLIKLIGISGIAMSLMLPIGIVPRLMQTHELNQTHAKIANQIPSVAVAHVMLAPAKENLSLPGTVQAIVET